VSVIFEDARTTSAEALVIVLAGRGARNTLESKHLPKANFSSAIVQKTTWKHHQIEKLLLQNKSAACIWGLSWQLTNGLVAQEIRK
jgi:hypothetical protein